MAGKRKPNGGGTPGHDLARSGRVGLAVMRLQPPHRGHMGLIALMLQDCDTVVLGFGSTQLSRQVRNPFTFEQRLEMVRIVFGDAVQPVPLVDIDSQVATDDWVDYVLEKVHKLGLPDPTDYYTGSTQDAKWYVNRFAQLTDPAAAVGNVTSYASPDRPRRLHVLDRAQTPFPPAEDIRSLIERRDPEWHAYVSARLVPYIEWHYPPELRVAVTGDAPPPRAPVGTRWADGERRVWVLHDDEKWRPERMAGGGERPV